LEVDKRIKNFKNMIYTETILNVKCGGCIKSIIKTVNEIPGLTNVSFDLENDTIQFETNETSKFVLVKNKLEGLGYPMDEDLNSVFKKAKSYVSCAIGRMKELQ
jgi:copper chaperone CopZ